MDLGIIQTNFAFRHMLQQRREEILASYTPSTDEFAELAQKQLAKNIEKEQKKYNLAQPKTDTPPTTPPVTRKTVILKDPTVALATKGNTSLKATHHHYCGFYSNTVLPEIKKTALVEVDGKEIALNTYNAPKAVNYCYSGNDTIITVEPAPSVSHEVCTDIPQGTIVKDYDTKATVGVITGKISMGTRDAYPIQNGFREVNIHLNGRTTRDVKTKPIVYGGKQFDTKADLMEYKASVAPLDPKTYKSVIYTDKANRHTQLVIIAHGHTIATVHLRHRLCDRYAPSPVKYEPYEESSAHAAGF